MTCALIVPVGNESSPSFTTSESVHQLIESVRADRMVVITRQGSPMRNREIDDAAVQSDVRDFLPNFLPTHGSQQIMIFAPPKEEAEGNTIASGKLESGDSFVVQDFPLEGKHFSRRLSFTSNLKATQSEMLFHVAGKKKKVFEPTVLTFSIHRGMVAALLACPPATPAPAKHTTLNLNPRSHGSSRRGSIAERPRGLTDEKIREMVGACAGAEA